jgi:hypothetical protein
MSRRSLLSLFVLLNLACWIGLFFLAWPTKDATPSLVARVER